MPPEPFELFQSHKESLDRLYEWEKRLYDEVRVRATAICSPDSSLYLSLVLKLISELRINFPT